MSKSSSGNLTISLSKKDAQKLQSTARALGTTRENVIRNYIRDGHEFLVRAVQEYQERQMSKGTDSGYMMAGEPVVESIGDNEGHP